MPSAAAAASAAALLFLPLLAAAGEGAVCPRPPAAAAVLRHAPASCSAADAPGPRRRQGAVVEVSLAFSFRHNAARNWLCLPVACAAGLPFGAREFYCHFASIRLCNFAFEGANCMLAPDLGFAQGEFVT